jgi:hypothetical protein
MPSNLFPDTSANWQEVAAKTIHLTFSDRVMTAYSPEAVSSVRSSGLLFGQNISMKLK